MDAGNTAPLIILTIPAIGIVVIPICRITAPHLWLVMLPPSSLLTKKSFNSAQTTNVLYLKVLFDNGILKLNHIFLDFFYYLFSS